MPKINYLILVFYSSTSYSILNSMDITLCYLLNWLWHNPTLQEIARAAAGGVDDSINLDVVAIEQLKKKATPPTNDLPKYSYDADENGFYSEYLSGVRMDSSQNTQNTQNFIILKSNWPGILLPYKA